MFSETLRPKTQFIPKCDCHKPGFPDCGDLNDKMRAEYRRLDIDDVTDSVMKVMRICGLKPWEVKLAASVIRRSFTYFEEIVEKIDRVPRKRFGKESFLHGLAHVAHMSRIDAQMAFAITKRAFKAFYYGTGVEGRRFACLQAKLLHGEECMWLHAAHRTAEIHAVLAGLMDSEKRLFEERIECVYKTLVDVLKSRILWENDMVCSCGQLSAPPSRTINIGKAVSQADSVYSAEIELLYHKEMKGVSSAPSRSSPRTPTANQSKDISTASSRHNHGLKKGNQTLPINPISVEPSAITSLDHPHCKCPKLRCWQENGESREAPEITAECSQGPYICRWLPYDGEEDQGTEHRVPYPPMDDICPPCPSDDIPCDPECTCTCDVCTCRPAYDDDFEEEHLGEKLSKSGIEDHDTDFCWVGPFHGSSVERLARKRAREEMLRAEAEFEEEQEEEEFPCDCTCEIKQRAFPHLFTYLTDFKDKQRVVEEPKPELETQPKVEDTESEDLLSKPPPYGVTLDTYRCWVKPTSSESESKESDEEKKKPPLVWVLANKPKPKPDIQITIKKQHVENTQVAPPPVAAPLPKAPVLPTKPAPTPAPSKPPLAPQKQDEKDEKLTKEDILDIIGLRFKQKK
ncbi:uncharacterized protein LOC110177365 [Drosophila serrata]|uniref:uncharacterized protein LOC110177365 n=1 Tax=Drosophila serrata TaxID=7274 RepID=UPI000A1D34FF|nr:uncharacterized protein LOC110177365 [Drosophila serrata]